MSVACGRDDAADYSAGDVASSAATIDSGSLGSMSGMMTDANIASTLLVANDGEVEGADDAMRLAADAEVKSFAAMVHRDHKALKEAVDSVAKAANISTDEDAAATAMKNSMEQHRDSLSKLSGAAFDRAYIESQVSAHQRMIDQLNQMAASSQNPQLTQLIRDAMPTMQAHLDAARVIHGKLTSGTL
jgi:putative membrane protein